MPDNKLEVLRAVDYVCRHLTLRNKESDSMFRPSLMQRVASFDYVWKDLTHVSGTHLVEGIEGDNSRHFDFKLLQWT